MTKKIIAALLGVLFLTACNPIQSGTITEMEFERGEWEYKTKDGKTSSKWDDADYEITFTGPNEDGKIESRTVEVSAEQYEKLKVGQRFSMK